jgi:hypothetical protein
MTSYDPKRVGVSFGPLPILGYASGSMIEVTMLGDGTRAAVGTQGEAVLVDNHNQSAEVKVRLMATGLGRNTLHFLRAHMIAGNPALPLMLNSLDTGEKIGGGVAKLKNYPDASLGDDAPIREVTFVVARLDQQNSLDLLAGVG